VQSGGLLRATPHYVRACRGPGASGTTRSTFALFMQPDVTQRLDAPPGACVGVTPCTHSVMCVQMAEVHLALVFVSTYDSIVVSCLCDTLTHNSIVVLELIQLSCCRSDN
jgi:hypothetical protein